jgi:hypothetical protein
MCCAVLCCAVRRHKERMFALRVASQYPVDFGTIGQHNPFSPTAAGLGLTPNARAVANGNVNGNGLLSPHVAGHPVGSSRSDR